MELHLQCNECKVFLWLHAKPLQSQRHTFCDPPCRRSYMAYESPHG